MAPLPVVVKPGVALYIHAIDVVACYPDQSFEALVREV
jgi:hypothetical protein